ncbi:MAG: hypothetical protein AAB349_01305 [Chloroflexota bacterium]
MVDLLVDLADTTIRTLLHRAERAGHSLNDEMLAILEAAVADESSAPDEAAGDEDLPD